MLLCVGNFFGSSGKDAEHLEAIKGTSTVLSIRSGQGTLPSSCFIEEIKAKRLSFPVVVLD